MDVDPGSTVPRRQLGRHLRQQREQSKITVKAASELLAEPSIPGAMQQQLWHLLKATELPHVSVRVLPLAVGPHRASVSGAFTILEFPADGDDKGEPPTVYSESLTGALYLERPRELATYEEVWSALAGLALSEGDSEAMIKRLIMEQRGT